LPAHNRQSPDPVQAAARFFHRCKKRLPAQNLPLRFLSLNAATASGKTPHNTRQTRPSHTSSRLPDCARKLAQRNPGS
jgi:hypothetical protein